MGRPFFPHEADDADLDWLVTNFLYERSDFIPVESEMVPLILMPYHEVEVLNIQEAAPDLVEVAEPTIAKPSTKETPTN